MQGAEQTTRQRIAEFLRGETAEAGRLATEFEITTSAALSHVEHIAKSLDDSEEQLLAAPPECLDCGFDNFDNLTNRPSRCPDCKSENVTEPTFTIQ
ncbi:MAG: putative Zn-ribbon and HTH transcriptional regulator [Natronomonas sp.]|jgi:predicted Zn-ribbon and HTH transcriptional regulator|uniref:transcriptional regulator n=1 Tax=Natronomonas sp. TaxID=2184060 RepID=UPI00398A2AD0